MAKPRRYFDIETNDDDDSSKSSALSKVGNGSEKQPKSNVITVVADTKSRPWLPRKSSSKYVKYNPSKPFPSNPALPKDKTIKYSRGTGLNPSNFTRNDTPTTLHHVKILKRDAKVQAGIKQAAGAEILLAEEQGAIDVEEGECSLTLTQGDIVKQVDLASATKSFHLNLDKFAPYHLDYALNGRQLVLGGRRGHIAAFDWISKKLLCEFHVMETIHDVKWLHNETMFAVAQKQWAYVYDNQGIEIHCLKKLDRIVKLEFLPYHFLLVGGHESGFLSWVDVSIGKIVTEFNTRQGELKILTSNPSNAIIHCGHANGTVTFWSPNVKTSVASILCHGSPVSAIAVDGIGRLMATGGMDGRLRIWDLRNSFTPLASVSYGTPSSISFSQKGLLSYSCQNRTKIYSEIGQMKKPFLQHISYGNVSSSQFCPFEDVLGLGTAQGFDSCLVPGAGMANFDALERNPFQTKNQRKEAEIKALLEKIQPELIALDNKVLGEVDTISLQKKQDDKPSYIKKSEIELNHRRKRKSAKIPKVKQSIQSEVNLRNAREFQQAEKIAQRSNANKTEVLNPDDPLSRFIPKKSKYTPS